MPTPRGTQSLLRPAPAGTIVMGFFMGVLSVVVILVIMALTDWLDRL